MKPAPESGHTIERDDDTDLATTRLLHSRLRAASVFVASLASVGLVWSLLVNDGLWPLHFTTAVCLGVAYAVLTVRRHTTRRTLRILEFAIFGVMAADLVAVAYHQMLAAAVREDLRSMMTERRNALVAGLHLIFAYAIFIPNTWRNAAPLIVLFAAAPIVTESVVAYQHPGLYHVAGDATAGPMVDWANLILMVMGASLAIYGTHVLNTLRQEVFEARRLNQYQLGELLGAGSMGEVYRAEHRLLKRPCAVKLIHAEKQRNPQALLQFEKEVRAAAQLSHPNIVEVYDYGHTDGGTFYYVMESLNGQSLEDLVQNGGPLQAENVINLLRQACDGLSEAHAAGLIHRDLKPANIFLANIGQRRDIVKVLDFGLVWQQPEHSESTTTADIAGTPAYMAPEQVQGNSKLDHRADIYALGCVGYYLLTGQPPFTASSPMAVMMAHVNTPVVPPSSITPDIEKDLEQIVLRCLNKNAAERFANATDLSLALSMCQSGRGPKTEKSFAN